MLRHIESFTLPLATIRTVFFDGYQNRRFPKCLTPLDALQALQESIANFLQMMREDFEETVWEDVGDDYHEATNEDIKTRPFGPMTGRCSNETDTDFDFLEGAAVWPKNQRKIEAGVEAPLPKTNRFAIELMHQNSMRSIC
jgi:hypothetical protein